MNPTGERTKTTNREKLAQIICDWDNNFRDVHDDKIGSLDIAELVDRLAVAFSMDNVPPVADDARVSELSEIRARHEAGSPGFADIPYLFDVIATLAEQVERLKGERDSLGTAIAEAAQKVGIYNGEVSLTGPELILLCDDLAADNARLTAQHDLAIKLGSPLNDKLAEMGFDHPDQHIVVDALQAIESLIADNALLVDERDEARATAIREAAAVARKWIAHHRQAAKDAHLCSNVTLEADRHSAAQIAEDVETSILALLTSQRKDDDQ